MYPKKIHDPRDKKKNNNREKLERYQLTLSIQPATILSHLKQQFLISPYFHNQLGLFTRACTTGYQLECPHPPVGQTSFFIRQPQGSIPRQQMQQLQSLVRPKLQKVPSFLSPSMGQRKSSGQLQFRRKQGPTPLDGKGRKTVLQRGMYTVMGGM